MKNIIVAILTLLFVFTFSNELSCSQSVNKSIKNKKIIIETEIPDYQKIVKITNWDIEISKYFVLEANNRNVSVFDEALPIISIETGDTYDFNLIHYNSNGTYDKGIFQINNITKPDIVRLLKAEGKEFDSWSRLNPEFNISAGMCWISHLKGKGLEDDSLFTSYNMGVYGAKKYADRNGTYVSKYSNNAMLERDKIKNKINKIKIKI